MKLYCKNCSNLITPYNFSLAEEKELNFEDEQELLDTNKYILANKVDFNFGVPIEYLINSSSTLLINHQDWKRLQGCCGSSEFDKLNQVFSVCKYEIGLLIADCWTPKFIGINANKISLKPLW